MGIEVCHFVPTLLGLLHSIWILSPSNFKSTNRFVYVKLDKRCESTGISSISNWQIWMYNLLNLNHIPMVLWRVSREDLGLPTSCLSKLAFPWVKHHVQSLEKQVLWLEFCSTGTVEFLEIFPPPSDSPLPSTSICLGQCHSLCVLTHSEAGGPQRLFCGMRGLRAGLAWCRECFHLLQNPSWSCPMPVLNISTASVIYKINIHF